MINATTKKDPYPLPFIEEVFDEVARHEVYSFFDGFFRLSPCHDHLLK